MRTTILKNWNLPRALRLVLGGAAATQGAMDNELMLVLAGGIIGAMALLNVGCCGASGCTMPPNNKIEEKPKEVIYEEVVK